MRWMDDRFVLLKAQETPEVSVTTSDWLDRINGGEGCWCLDEMVQEGLTQELAEYGP